MAQVIPLRPHTFRLDNCLIDTYAAEMGAIGLAIYAVLQRYADRTTGQCWPSVATIAKLLRLSKNCVKKYLHQLAQLGLISWAHRSTTEGDPTSNLYTVHDPTQQAAVQRRQEARGGAAAERGGSPHALPPQETAHRVPHPGAPDAPKQAPPEQEIRTNLAHAKNSEPACDQPGHAHWSPYPGFTLCRDCFRGWEIPLTSCSPAGVSAASVEPPPLTACSG